MSYLFKWFSDGFLFIEISQDFICLSVSFGEDQNVEKFLFYFQHEMNISNFFPSDNRPIRNNSKRWGIERGFSRVIIRPACRISWHEVQSKRQKISHPFKIDALLRDHVMLRNSNVNKSVNSTARFGMIFKWMSRSGSRKNLWNYNLARKMLWNENSLVSWHLNVHNL